MNTVLGQIAVLDCLPCPIWLLCLDCFLCRYRCCAGPPLYWDSSMCWDTSLWLDWWLDPAAFNWLARFVFKWSESEKQNTASIYSKNAGSWKYRKMLRDLTEFTHNVVTIFFRTDLIRYRVSANTDTIPASFFFYTSMCWYDHHSFVCYTQSAKYTVDHAAQLSCVKHVCVSTAVQQRWALFETFSH